MLPKVKRTKYSAKFKLQVIKFVSDNAKNSAARRQFVVDENLVRDWRQKIEKSSFPRTKCAEQCQLFAFGDSDNEDFLGF